jgi:hypothetical protein
MSEVIETREQEQIMYAINIRELSYACGNIYAIYTNKECAKKCIQEKFPGNTGAGLDDTWYLFPYDDDEQKKSITAEIIKVPINTWIKESLNKCAGCMSSICEQEHLLPLNQ